ncbi:MAG: hypothetical protein PUC47_02080 [Oscillospiraceae bacterium]|nr:hypothetical protein [Oscillospiraceae bacterium]
MNDSRIAVQDTRFQSKYAVDTSGEPSERPREAHAMSICVDSFHGGLAQGRLHNYYYPEEISFHSLDQLLLAIEDLMNLAQSPQPDTDLRRTFTASRRRRTESADKQDAHASITGKPCGNLYEFRTPRGRVANFYLRIYARQHASMQGTLLWNERRMQMSFRSALELLLLLRNALTRSEESEEKV